MFHLVICGWKKKYFSVQGWFVKKETAGKSTQLPPGKESLIDLNNFEHKHKQSAFLFK